MSPEEQDRELSRLYRRSSASTSPPELDQRILAAAQALAPQRRVWYRHSWMPALSAVLVVGVALTLTVPLGKDPAVVSGAGPDEVSDMPLNRPERALLEQLDYDAPADTETAAPARAGAASVAAKKVELGRLRELAAPAALPAPLPESRVRELSARQWLAQVEDLLQQGQAQAARDAFLKFRERYPEFDVDPILLERLGPLKAATELN